MNILITGTRKGIGNSLARYYLALGHNVIGCSRQHAEIEHEQYVHFCIDVSDEQQVISLVRQVKKSHGHIDVLINNAGIASMNHLLTTPATTVTKMMQTNFMGTFLFTREVAKLMMKKRSGSIVNFSTVAVPLDLAGEAVYVATKSAVESLTKVSAKELAPLGIRVNAIGPTPIPTDLIKTLPKDKVETLLEKQALPRLGTIEDIENVVDFLISERSSFITGQIIYLGGVF
ncbi:SDR family NAD(P)-dependent oxidoreductase [Shewanella halifaxensis]|uniref:SDR family NAD(P)-dependent oxidoreductase n=1 Tax=Shewanella halifaxensis TaxID=271098 RepID=UPI001F3EBDEC|nr:SDR family oxidoreductase [Shewanella halifaxensis]